MRPLVLDPFIADFDRCKERSERGRLIEDVFPKNRTGIFYHASSHSKLASYCS